MLSEKYMSWKELQNETAPSVLIPEGALTYFTYSVQLYFTAIHSDLISTSYTDKNSLYSFLFLE